MRAYSRSVTMQPSSCILVRTCASGMPNDTENTTRFAIVYRRVTDGAELDAAILNAIFASYIESPHDPALVESALAGAEELPAYQTARTDFHKEKRLSINGARIPILFPGEKINTVSAARPTTNFADFEKAVLRNFASAAGLSAQQVSQDWSDVNYSSARGALLEAWKTLDRRRFDYAIGFASPVRGAWLEECHEVDKLPMPNGSVPDFPEARAAFGRADVDDQFTHATLRVASAPRIQLQLFDLTSRHSEQAFADFEAAEVGGELARGRGQGLAEMIERHGSVARDLA